MADDRTQTGLLRPRDNDAHARVTNVELFFDLVFVFAITQLSHTLLADLTWLGAVKTGLLFLAVWWVWIYTCWVTNWLDPDRVPVRLLMLVLMLAGLLLSTSIPRAFGDRGFVFAGAYVFMQVGRSLFMLWGLGGADPANTRNFQRITLWLLFSGVFWLTGATFDGNARLAIWAGALALDFVGPSIGFYVPGLGRSTTGDWNVEGSHLAERCSLFVIIALGESVVVTGATFAGLGSSTETVLAFVVAFVATVAMWWIYFDTGAEQGVRRFEQAETDAGRLARLAYTYIHLLIVGGIVVSAVADELVLAHPHGHMETKNAVAIIGGPALYLLGTLLFRRAVTGYFRLSHLLGLAMLAGFAFLAAHASALVLGAATSAVLVLVAIWETVSLGPRRPKRLRLS